MAILLAHSPLLSAGSTWGDLPGRLAEPVLVPDVSCDDTPPYVASYIAGLLTQVRPKWPIGEPVTVIAHSGAGPILPAMIAALTAAKSPVVEAVFLDAGLPTSCLQGLPAQPSRLSLLDAENQDVAAQLRAHLARGGRFPNWTADDLAGIVPDPRALVAGMRPRGADFFAEPLPDGPLRVRAGYVQLSETYRPYADRAAELGWPVARAADLHHFAPLTDPDTVVGLLRQVRARRK
jgi:hypothetical protein